jgi:hypothetical protein
LSCICKSPRDKPCASPAPDAAANLSVKAIVVPTAPTICPQICCPKAAKTRLIAYGRKSILENDEDRAEFSARADMSATVRKPPEEIG